MRKQFIPQFLRTSGTPFLFLFLFLFCRIAATAQSRVWVFFTDKPISGAPALSSEALEARRARNIQVDSRDFPVSEDYLSCLRSAGCQVLSSSRWLNAASVVTTLSEAQLKSACAGVKSVQPVRTLVRQHTGAEFNAPVAKATGTPNGFSQAQLALSGITCLHDAGFRGDGVTIAVMDAGYTTADTSRAFAAARTAGRITHEWDFVDNDPSPYDGDYHGLFILGTLTADLPGELMGSAPRATYMLARTEQVASETHVEEDNWMKGMEWADSIGTDVISSSLGYSVFSPGEGDYTYADMDGNTTIITKAADIAASRGILVVNSAGNEGSGPWHYITAPCDADSILCIGAVDQFEVQAGFSSFGPSSDGRVKPDIVAMGVDVATIDPFGGVGFVSGTSLSCPVAAGLSACLIGKHPGRPMMDILHAIQQSADRYALPDTGYGYGLANGCKADSLLDILDARDAAVTPQQGLQVYPNPGTAEVFLFLEKGMSEIAITDPQGREVLRTSATGTGRAVNTAALPAGIWFIRVTSATGEIFATRWVKVK